MVYRTGEAAEVRYECEKHGEVLQLASDHIRYGCGKCSPSGVMGNKHTTAISESLGLLGLSTLDEHRIGSSRKRWDVVVPDANIAVEFDGIYYHSEKFKSDKSYMRTKAAEAQLNGYRQINIWEDEWHNKKEIVKRLLASACGKSTEPTIYARKTSIVELEKTDVQKFIDDNHIQGFGSGSHYLGLKSGDSLVACMVYSYKGAGRSTKVVEDCVDIQRYATSCHVVGGFQKLLKHILLDEKVKAVISYSDPRLFTGVMYEKAGFVASPEGGPDYCYVKGSKRIPKRARQKSWFKGRDGVLYDPTLTEYELALLNGYQRLWFRGKVKWTLVR
jgi:very-short-patch-repair endonuclease